MGFIDKAKGLLGGGSDDSVDEEWGDEEEWADEEDEWAGEDEWDEEEDDEIQTWDTYYQFADDALQHRGFSGVNEFVKKAMIYKINRDPANRDRIKVGRQTMQMVGDTMEVMDRLEGDDHDDWEQKAEKLENAARIKDAIEDFQNKEEQMVQDAMGLVGDFVDAYAENKTAQSGNVDTSTSRSNERL